MSEAEGSVIVVDDDPAVRKGLQNLLRSVGLRVELLSTAHQLSDRSLPEDACCIVLDVRLPGKSGFDVLDELRKAKVGWPVIFLTGHGDARMAVRAMKAGAHDFFTKPFREQELLDAIQSALDRDRSRREQERVSTVLLKRFETLTAREREVMQLVAAGLPNKSIAADLGVSEITVKAHRGRVMRKMKSRSLPDLVRMTERLKSVQPRA